MVLATSISPSCSSSNTTTRLEEVREWTHSFDKNRIIYLGTGCKRTRTSQIFGLTASVASEVLVPKGSVSDTSRPKFPPRRPIQRALSVSEENLIPISDLILLTEYPVSPLHNPIVAFHEATNYVYFPTPTTEYIDKNQNALISAASPPLFSSANGTQGRGDAAGLLIATVKSFAERTVHFLYQLIPMKGNWTRWCSRAESEGAQEKQSVRSFCRQDRIDCEARSSLPTDPDRNSAEFWHLESEEDEGHISDIGSPILDDFMLSYSQVERASGLEDEDEVCVLLQEGANLPEELISGLVETSTNEPCSQSVGLDCQIVFPPILNPDDENLSETDSSNNSELDWDGNYAGQTNQSNSVSWDRISVPRTFPVVK
ncbi:uncharacterized protein C8R40DRAFT_1171060 [Lentinula edodes]|uniref:uncharacterized protein n=1 Tax=Lentinula edodes TaxID=5353 RepID=UPI001BF66528|nr:uncharacterized protein C8R40DRAFT_1171060 [Lentinula edodes]KAF8830909.1 hypothetical protein HHX47_DHR1000177 [Lentinula edodes]KAH7874955.1 hypothetical protein C8R40DRAFT_1171060 [Lentinula edodes]